MNLFYDLRRIYLKSRLKNREFEWIYDKYEQDEIVSFDCETTGLDTKKDEILTIGAVIIKNNTILTSQKFEINLKPNIALNENSIKIHHILKSDLNGGFTQTSGVIEFLNFAKNRPLLGYYAQFDVMMVQRVFLSLGGTALPNKIIEISSIYHDKKQKLIPQSHINLSYNAILSDLDIPSFPRHSAIGDAITNALIWLKLKNNARF